MPDPAVTDAAGHRSRWFRRPWILVLGVVVLMGAVAFTISESARLFVYLATEICIYGVPSDEDVHEAAAVKGTITAIDHFTRNSVLQPDSPPVSSHPGSRMILTQPTAVVVYEIRDRAEQDRVIAAVQAVVRERKFRAVDLRFMDHKNWVVHGNVGERGPELQLR